MEAAIGFVGDIVGGLFGASSSKKAAKAQTEMFKLGIEEQRRQYDQTRTDLLPWLSAGSSALGGLLDIVGLNGGAKQQASIDAIRSSPMFASLLRQGEEGILQNASATGGLRGGNIQHSLADFRSDLLASEIERQYAKLGGISGAGAQTGATIGGFGQNSANAISQLFGNIGQAKAGGIIGRAQGLSQAIGGVFNGLGAIFGF